VKLGIPIVFVALLFCGVSWAEEVPKECYEVETIGSRAYTCPLNMSIRAITPFGDGVECMFSVMKIGIKLDSTPLLLFEDYSVAPNTKVDLGEGLFASCDGSGRYLTVTKE
jgi:hypothetical protein